ncbi:MATE family efflux transporter [Enterococcus thailandicus]|uniref:Probable multidrug resistance protein NorM n=1 Tax=Enterococcus thailandicus TaxID=417368 RepID=A0A1L8XPA0_ENTTH|nr:MULTISPECIES: MATE family efflux transporter [Enterococcus]ASZ06541.1 MATE family efflux transporter [Enterococcus thailandicus]OJG95061.1 diguanylate cyclase [Enterococcus thailandicus]OTP22516.1 MATE efflux family protein [Enterococcus sp. 5B7_DIV0075]GEK37037.1 MATE family efflux transporter [Enterococcus thailandicus]
MRELTKGNPAKLIFIFTIPLLIGNIFQQFYNMVDMIIVGQTLGKNALAAVGSTGSLTFLIIGFAQGLTAGLAIITAQRFGAQDYRGLKKSFATSIIISLVVTIILTVLSLLFIRPMLQLMQTPPEIIDQAQAFISIILMGLFASMSFNLLSNVIRALGDSRTPLFFLIIAVIINVILDLVFIIHFGMGVEGAGIATVIAQVASSLLCLIYIKRKIPLLQLRKKDFVFDKKEIRTHLNISLPMAFQASIIAIGAIILQSALNSLGTDVVAAQAAAGRIDQFATQPMMSFGITMATFTAQNYGAKEYGRILKGVKQCLLMSGGFSIIAGAVVIIFGHSFVHLFVDASETRVFELAQIYFNINGSLYWILAILFILRYTLQGLGQSKIPTIAGIMELIMRSFAAIFLTALWGYPGAAAASPLAWIGSVAVLLYSYFKAIKKLRKLDEQQQLERTLEA